MTAKQQDSTVPFAFAVWYGIEVEGRLRGTPTVYVGNLDRRLFPRDLQDAPARHLWINPEYLRAQGFEAIGEFLEAGWQVTATLQSSMLLDPRVVAILESYRGQPRLHVVVAFPATAGLFRLRPDDEIRLDLGFQNVLTARKKDFVHSAPADYARDQPLSEAVEKYRLDRV